MQQKSIKIFKFQNQKSTQILGAVNKCVLLITPSSTPQALKTQTVSPNLGIVRLAGFLRANGVYAEYFDTNLHTLTGLGVSLEEKLAQRQWDIVGVSCLDETLLADIDVMYKVSKLLPDAMIIAGGIEAQFNYQTILDKSPCSVVVIAEGEIPLLSIARGVPLHEIPGLAIKTPSKPLTQEIFSEATLAIPWEEIPYEHYWDYYMNLYGDAVTSLKSQEIHTVRVFSRNRCPIGCKFCSSTNQLTWGSDSKVPVLGTTESELVHVIKRIKDSHPRTKTIYLTDDDFVINRASVRRFCEEVQKVDLGDLSFMCFARATDLDEDILSYMSKANFRRFIIGIESFSQKILDHMGKRCDVDDNHRAIELCNRYGIKPHINVILTPPNSTIDDVMMTINAALHYLDEDKIFCGVINAIRPLNGTLYREQNCDFKTIIHQIPGTEFTLKEDELIWVEDPYVREAQVIYHEGIKDHIAKKMKEQNIVHASSNNVALISLNFMKNIIETICIKNNINLNE